MPDTGTDGLQGFFTYINGTAAGQLLSLAANSIQVGLFIYNAIEGLNPGNTQEILDKIALLQESLDYDFEALGNLIRQQIQVVLDNENAIAIAQALAHTNTALDKMNEYLRAPNATLLDDADTESDLGIQFFLALPAGDSSSAGLATRTDPMFIPAISAAAVTRVLVLGTMNPNVPADAGAVAQIKNIISLFQGMIDTVTQSVSDAHTIAPKAVEIKRATGPVVMYEGYSHQEYGQVLRYFAAPPSTDFQNPTMTKAKQEAEAARKAGVSAELAYIGIPEFEQLVQQWSAIVSSVGPVHPPVVHPGPIRLS
jgi:hypothetical protein